MVSGGPQVQPVFRWEFNSLRSFRRALEEYGDYLDNTVVTRYGPRTGDTMDPEAQMNAMRRRSEIDACMDILAVTAPLLWRLVDVHFRRGADIEPQRWLTTAACVGLRRARCPQGVRCALPGLGYESRWGNVDVPACGMGDRLRCQDDRDMLLQGLGMAVRRLYAIHQDRCAQ